MVPVDDLYSVGVYTFDAFGTEVRIMTTEPTADQMRAYQAEQRANAADNLAREVVPPPPPPSPVWSESKPREGTLLGRLTAKFFRFLSGSQ